MVSGNYVKGAIVFFLLLIFSSPFLLLNINVIRINNKAGPHNVVFDEDAIPDGVSQEAISMDTQLGEEGETFSMKFDKAGTYEYYCEPHRGAGMMGTLVVT